MNKVSVYIGDRIKSLRDDAGLSQLEVSNKLGISRASLANYEVGKQRIQTDDLYRLAAVLGVGPKDLLPDKEPSEDEIKIILKKREKKICHCCNQIIKEPK